MGRPSKSQETSAETHWEHVAGDLGSASLMVSWNSQAALGG